MPKNRNTFSFLARWPRRAASRAVHLGWAWAQRAGAVTAEHPGR
ncbi:acyltransferase, partial [Streptomyces sp. SID7982]|nr:acyltransferase [Streptomyces sp. SID7982]